LDFFILKKNSCSVFQQVGKVVACFQQVGKNKFLSAFGCAPILELSNTAKQLLRKFYLTPDWITKAQQQIIEDQSKQKTTQIRPTIL